MSKNEKHVKIKLLYTGIHFVAKALGTLIAKPAQEIISKHIYHNFEALCTGQEKKQ